MNTIRVHTQVYYYKYIIQTFQSEFLIFVVQCHPDWYKHTSGRARTNLYRNIPENQKRRTCHTAVHLLGGTTHALQRSGGAINNLGGHKRKGYYFQTILLLSFPDNKKKIKNVRMLLKFVCRQSFSDRFFVIFYFY